MLSVGMFVGLFLCANVLWATLSVFNKDSLIGFAYNEQNPIGNPHYRVSKTKKTLKNQK